MNGSFNIYLPPVIPKYLALPIAIFLGIFLLDFYSNPEPSKSEQSLLVMSYNLRFDTPEDGNNRWDLRKDQVVNLIQFYEPVFIGTQEGLLHQLKYLKEELSKYKWIGVGRDDGSMEGEFSALLYDTTTVELIEGSEHTIWLSETPSKPSKSWDSALPRILTFGQFRNKADNSTFFVFNTHFDHAGEIARAKSAELVVNKVNEIAKGKPAILTGDFNFTPDSKPYAVLTSDNSSLEDTFEVSSQPHVGPLFTFEGFKVRSENGENRRIDYIFVNDKVQVLKHAIIPTFREYHYPSDHLPVIAEVTFNVE